MTLPEPDLANHDAWTIGTNNSGSGGKRPLRIVMRLQMALDILKHGDLVCFLHQRRFMIQVTDVQHDRIHCKVLELALNYHERMLRHAFRVPPNNGPYCQQLETGGWLRKCSRYIHKWIDLIISEKNRQMQLPDDMWPPWSPRSEVANVFDMPIVMWLSKEKKGNNMNFHWC